MSLKVLGEAERKVFTLLLAGKTAKQIGLELGRSEKTIATQKHIIKRKLGLPNDAALFTFGVKNGLILQKYVRSQYVAGLQRAIEVIRQHQAGEPHYQPAQDAIADLQREIRNEL